MEEMVPNEVKERINMFPNPSQRANIFRYWILYENGGIDVDTDMWPTKSIESFIDTIEKKHLEHGNTDNANICVVCNEEEGEKPFCSRGFIAATKHHEILKIAAYDNFADTKKKNPKYNDSQLTGPTHFGSVLSRIDKEIWKCIHLPTRAFYPLSYRECCKLKVHEVLKLAEKKGLINDENIYGIHLWARSWRQHGNYLYNENK